MNRVLTNTMTVLSSMLLCTACIYDIEDGGTNSPATSTTPSTYLQIDFNTQVSSATKADNTTSEETGQTYENAISSAAVFLYESTTGVNDTNGDIDVKPITFGSDDIPDQTGNNTIVTTLAKEVENISPGTYHVIAVANPIDDLSGLATLSAVRDYVEQKAWKYDEDEDKYSEFLMSSASDATVTLNYNTKGNPATVRVDVQRMAARVDCATSSFNSSYSVTDGTGSVELTGAVLVNDLNSGSYLLKRVSDGEGEDVTYLGDEGTGDNANYVIDPWTEKKTGGTVTGLTYGIPYPGYALSTETDYDGNTQEAPAYWNGIIGTTYTTITDGEEKEWYRIGYTMENTTFKDNTSKEYATGVVFKGKFTPTTVDRSYSDYTSSNGTFFKWSGKFYATLEDIMTSTYSGEDFINDFDESLTTGTTWEEVSALVAKLSGDPTGYKAYLEDLISNGTGTLTTNDATNLSWEHYANSTLDYEYETNDEGKVKSITLQTDARAKIASASGNAISTYENGQCYYTWWIRHQDDENDETNGVMEYAIVRNNVYKLTVESVSTIGGDIPSEGIIVNVKVQNWQSGGEEEVNL